MRTKRKQFRPPSKGFTLLETLVGMSVSFFLLAATIAFLIPSANAFKGSLDANETRLQVAAVLDSLEKDAASMLAIYVDPAQCYAVCMVDGNNNRLYYYWDQNSNSDVKTLYRKKEPVTTAITCSGGQTFARGLDTTKSSFAMTGNELIAKMTAYNNSTKSDYSATTGIFPLIQERQVILTEGFECATLRQGWVVTNGASNTWNIQVGANMGNYQIGDSDGANGVSDSTTIEIPIDLSRISNAHLRFRYMNSGTLSATDSFQASLYDGTTWQTVYNDTTHLPIASPSQVESDLSGYALNKMNKLRFTGVLKNAGSNWYVDGISVFNP